MYFNLPQHLINIDIPQAGYNRLVEEHGFNLPTPFRKSITQRFGSKHGIEWL
jgi:hypothetical protein